MDANAINEELVQTIRRVREAAAAADQQKTIESKSGAEIKVELPADQDSQLSESDGQSAPLDELTLDNEADDENRNKR